MTEMAETFGTWAAAHPGCLAMSTTSDEVKMAQLCFCMLCVCQIIFMLSQYPKVGWEAIYMPACECFLYGLASTGNGFIQLADGRMIPWARMAAWICTCPSLLMQINTMHKCKLSHFNLNTFIVQADLIMNIMGINGTLTNSESLKWMYFAIGCVLFGFILVVVFDIMTTASNEWRAKGDAKALLIASRILILRSIFMISWSCYPLLWILSPQGTCAVSENVISVSHFVCDACAKNLFGFIMWMTVWRELNGHWDVNYHYPAQDTKEHELSCHSYNDKDYGRSDASPDYRFGSHLQLEDVEVATAELSGRFPALEVDSDTVRAELRRTSSGLVPTQTLAPVQRGSFKIVHPSMQERRGSLTRNSRRSSRTELLADCRTDVDETSTHGLLLNASPFRRAQSMCSTNSPVPEIAVGNPGAVTICMPPAGGTLPASVSAGQKREFTMLDSRRNTRVKGFF